METPQYFCVYLLDKENNIRKVNDYFCTRQAINHAALEVDKWNEEEEGNKSMVVNDLGARALKDIESNGEVEVDLSDIDLVLASAVGCFDMEKSGLIHILQDGTMQLTDLGKIAVDNFIV